MRKSEFVAKTQLLYTNKGKIILKKINCNFLALA